MESKGYSFSNIKANLLSFISHVTLRKDIIFIKEDRWYQMAVIMFLLTDSCPRLSDGMIINIRP